MADFKSIYDVLTALADQRRIRGPNESLTIPANLSALIATLR
jgi:hypothetical protein